MIIEISYSDHGWDYPGEQLGELRFGEDSFVELLKMKAAMYLVHYVESWSEDPQDARARMKGEYRAD